MAGPLPEASEVIRDAAWLAHRYDLASDSLLFRWTPREAHRAVPFLTDSELGDPVRSNVILPLGGVADCPQAPVHFIFHSAFCNSTLLARALDVEGLAMSLSEPVLLNDLVGLRRRKAVDARQVGALADSFLSALARPWGAEEAVLIKPSNILNPIAGPLLQLRPNARAVLLTAPLPLFLNSVARKGLWCRLWARELAEGLLRDGVLQPLGFTPEELFRQSDLQVAAVGWLAQQRLFAQLVEQFGRQRVATLDSEALIERPALVLSAVGRHLCLPLDQARAAQLANGPAFTRHSKNGASFSAQARKAAQQSTEEAHGEEIATVVRWAEEVAARAGISLQLSASLVN